MNTVTNNVTKMVNDFQAATVTNRSELDAITLNGRQKVWENIAEAVLIAQKIIKPENKDDYHAALKAHGIDVPTEGKKVNPYGPVVKLLYGDWKDDQANVFQPNRSAEKYACVFRYFSTPARRGKFDTIALIVKHIETFSEPAFGSNLKGIEAKDRSENKKTGGTPKAASTDNYDLGLRPDKGEVARLGERPEFVPEDVSFGKLWFRMVDGEVIVMGYQEVSEDTFKALAVKRGKAIREAHAAELA
jgi:hypothetical protein